MGRRAGIIWRVDGLLFSAFFALLSANRSAGLSADVPELFPANAVPPWADILLGIFLPRVLILIYIYQNMGYDNVWFIAHLVVAILAYLGVGHETRRRRVRKDEG